MRTALVCALLSSAAHAQEPLRVLRHAPADTARPGDVITVSFDRPAAGSLERTADPARFVRVHPPIDARVEWRDPATIRVVPTQPLTPGTAYTLTIGNHWTAIDGGRLAEPYRFTIRLRGPALLASSPGLSTDPYHAPPLAPDGKLTLLYSAPVDSALFARTVRLQLDSIGGCAPRVVRFAPRVQRPVRESDGYGFRHGGGWDRDTLGDRFRRVVELFPETKPPEGCSGMLHLPSLDPHDRAEVRYRLWTSPRFTFSVWCQGDDCAAGSGLRLSFTAPVRREDVLRHVRIEPEIGFTVGDASAPSAGWALRFAIKPRTTYRVTVDSAMTDVFGRRITGRRLATVTTGDRHATLGHQLDFFTVPRSAPILRVTHVNIDRAEMIVVPIPDSLRAVVLSWRTDPDSVARMVARLRDTVRQAIRLRAPFNEERTSDIPIPPRALRGPGASLLAVRVWPRVPQKRDELVIRENGQLESVTIIAHAGDRHLAARSAIIQVTDLVAHAKVGDGAGAVLVTDVNDGRPVAGASVTVRDARGLAMSTGVTDARGVANLRRSPVWRPDPTTTGEDSDWYEGFGWWNTNDDPARTVEATRGLDRSVTRLRTWGWRPEPLAPNALGAHYRRAPAAHGVVYTERDIYRPGETVYVGAIVRLGALGALRTPLPGDSVRLRVTRDLPEYPAWETVRDTVLGLGEFGTVADSFRFRPSAPLGNHTVRVDVAERGTWRLAGTTDFRFAEYRAPEFRAELTIDSAARYLGDSVRARVTASYYFGAPMAGAEVRWRAVTSEVLYGTRVRGLPERFVIGRPYDGGDPRPQPHYTQGVDTLDTSGSATLSIPTTPGAIASSGEIAVEIAVGDVNRQSVAARQAVPIHASRLYVAARDSVRSWYWTQGEPRAIEVLAVRPSGERVAGARVRVAIVHHRFAFSEDYPGSYANGRWVADTIHHDSVVTADSIVTYRFTPRDHGRHQLVLAAEDERGRVAITSIDRWVIGPGWAAWWGATPARLPLRLSRDTLAPGDTAVVELLSPFDSAEAWVTAEREELVWQRRLAVGRGSVTVRVPITSVFIPGVQLSVLLVPRGVAWRTDSVHHRIRAGYVPLTVDRTSKQLLVDVRPTRAEYRPRDLARIAVRVRSGEGRPVRSQVTLWAVDEGVLSLTGFVRPDPVASMFAGRETALWLASTMPTLASRRRILSPPGWTLRAVSALGMTAGNAVARVVTGVAEADNPEMETNVRFDFRTTAFYLASVVTNDSGAATATVALPDNITTYRVMAVAATAEDRFGSAESPLLVTKPLIARAALPRFVRAGDELLAGAVINSRAGDARPVQVRAAGRGVTLLGSDLQERTLGAGTGSEVRFRWRASDRERDSVAFQLAVAGGPDADAVEMSVPVRPPYAPRFHTVSGIARGSETVRLALPRGIDPAGSRLTLRVGTTPVPVIRSAWERMRVYSYYCSEQLASIGMVGVAMLRLEAAGVRDSVNVVDVRNRLQAAVDELGRRQRDDGGIAYWRDYSWTTHWLSTHVGLFLTDARDLGIEVQPRLLERLTEFVRLQTDSTPWMRDSVFGTRAERERMAAWRLANEVAVLHYLRRVGNPDTVRENRVIAARSGMRWEDRVWLVDLLGRRPDRTVARRLLAEVWRDVEVAGTRVDLPDSLLRTLGFSSHIRPPARLLLATLAIDGEHRLLAPLIERVVQQGRASERRMWNTQDYAAAATALAAVAVRHRDAATRPAVVTVRAAARGAGDRVLLRRSASDAADSLGSLEGLLERDGDWVVLPLRVESGGALVYWTITVEEVPLERPTAPDAKGIIVERWYERFDDARAVTEVKEGDLVRVRLRITVPADREFVAVEDMMPAGLEAVDLSLRTSGTLGPFESAASRQAAIDGDRANPGASSTPWYYGSWDAGWWTPWEHREMRDDRVLWFARMLWRGSYTASYLARATTAGTFVRPPAHAEEMYNPALGGRSEGGVFRVVAQ